MRLSIVFLVTLALSFAAAYGDGIVNGDFDGVLATPPAAPWVSSGPTQIWPSNTDPGLNSQVARLGLGAGNLATLSQTFDCGAPEPGKVCTVGLFFVWAPNEADPGADEAFEILDGGTVLFTRTFADGLIGYTLVYLDFGDCGAQTITFRLSDPTDNTLDSWAYVDYVFCSCEAPVPVEQGTWGAIKSLY